jgi:hypothetical protein
MSLNLANLTEERRIYERLRTCLMFNPEVRHSLEGFMHLYTWNDFFLLIQENYSKVQELENALEPFYQEFKEYRREGQLHKV